MADEPRETEAAARGYADYLALGEGRSLARLLQVYQESAADPPTLSLGTLKDWSEKYHWQARVDEHVFEVNRLALERLRKNAAGERVKDFRRLEALLRALDDEKASRVLATLTKPSDLRNLVKTKHELLGEPLAERHEYSGPDGSAIKTEAKVEHGIPDGQLSAILANAAAVLGPGERGAETTEPEGTDG